MARICDFCKRAEAGAEPIMTALLYPIRPQQGPTGAPVCQEASVYACGGCHLMITRALLKELGEERAHLILARIDQLVDPRPPMPLERTG